MKVREQLVRVSFPSNAWVLRIELEWSGVEQVSLSTGPSYRPHPQEFNGTRHIALNKAKSFFNSPPTLHLGFAFTHGLLFCQRTSWPGPWAFSSEGFGGLPIGGLAPVTVPACFRRLSLVKEDASSYKAAGFRSEQMCLAAHSTVLGLW